jgi:AraC-like DNA-binding protein
MPVGGNCGYAVTKDHKHPSYMFVLAYDYETEVIIANKIVQSSPNSIFCLSPDIKHHEVQNYLPPKYCAIFIDKEFFEESLKSYNQENTIFNGLIVDIKSSKLELLVRDFINEAQNQDLSYDMILESISTLVTHEIIRTIFGYSKSKPILSQNMVINEAVRFINSEFEKDITIEDLAKVVNLSKSHFTTIFTKEMKISPMSYLKSIRLQNAKKLLRVKELSITEVATKCGFNSASYFTKIFKEHFSQTPKEFINSTP